MRAEREVRCGGDVPADEWSVSRLCLEIWLGCVDE